MPATRTIQRERREILTFLAAAVAVAAVPRALLAASSRHPRGSEAYDREQEQKRLDRLREQERELRQHRNEQTEERREDWRERLQERESEAEQRQRERDRFEQELDYREQRRRQRRLAH